MQRRHGRLALVLTLSWLTWSSPAAADDKETAAALLAQGDKEMEAGNYAEACPAFAESHRIDLRPETLFTLADCEAKLGKVASSLRHYQDYLSRYERMSPELKAEQGERPERAREQLAMLQSVTPTLVIEIPANAPPDTTVERDDEPVAEGQWGTPIPVDPGHHRVVVKAPGHPPKEYIENLAKGDSAVVRVTFGPIAPDADPDDQGDPQPDEGTAANGGDDSESGAVQRGFAYGAWALGGAAGIVSIIGGAIAWNKRSTIKDNCQGPICNQDGKDAADAAQTAATVSNIGLVIGGVGLVAGTVLYLTAPSGTPDDAAARSGLRFALGPAGGSISLEASW